MTHRVRLLAHIWQIGHVGRGVRGENVLRVSSDPLMDISLLLTGHSP